MTYTEVFDLRKQRKYWAIGVAISVVTAFALLQPMQEWTQAQAQAQAPAPAPAPAPAVTTQSQDVQLQQLVQQATRCETTIDSAAGGAQTNQIIVGGRLIADPTEMNTVYSPSNNEVKTVHVDKEVAICITDDGPIIFEVSIYTEIKEALQFQSPISKIFEVAICAKELNTAEVLGCFSSTRLLIPQSINIPVKDCEPIANPFPIEMNTVIGAGTARHVVKTIEAEKEIFNCAIDTELATAVGQLPVGTRVIKDVVIFTEIFEDIVKNTIIGKKFEVATCLKLGPPSPPIPIACTAASLRNGI